MGLFSSISSSLGGIGGILGGGGGGGGGVSSGGIGSKTGNTDNAGNTTATTTTTTTNNTDKRQVLNSGAIGIAADSNNPININNTTSDPQNYAALMAVTDHLATGTLMLMAANMDAANQQSAGGTVSKAADKAAQGAANLGQKLTDFYAAHKTAVVLGAGVIAYLIWRHK